MTEGELQFRYDDNPVEIVTNLTFLGVTLNRTCNEIQQRRHISMYEVLNEEVSIIFQNNLSRYSTYSVIAC